jgi:hypothetical protein
MEPVLDLWPQQRRLINLVPDNILEAERKAPNVGGRRKVALTYLWQRAVR